MDIYLKEENKIMKYLIKEDTENKIIGAGDKISIDIIDFNLLINNTFEELVELLFNENKLLNFIRPNNKLKEAMLYCIINDEDVSSLNDLIAEQSLPLFSLAINSFHKLRKDYQRLKNINNAKEIVIKCNRNNLIKGLELAKKFDKKTIIYCHEISLHEYKKIFDKYNIEELKTYDIKIDYQEGNSPIKPLILYNLSYKICSISDEIKKYNLSKIEQ